MRKTKWSDFQLRNAVKTVFSIRQLLGKLGLREAGGNYSHIAKYLIDNSIDTSHFRGRGWSRGLIGIGKPRVELGNLLVNGSAVQSYKLKQKLFAAKLKSKACEICSWAKISDDGRIPLELHHINGDRKDNRLANL